MIRVTEETGVRVFTGTLPRGLVAFVDAEWALPASADRIPAVLVPADPDPDAAAVRAIGGIAAAAAHAARSALLPGERQIEVWGRGAVALATATALGVEPGDGGLRGTTRPVVVVETTGDPVLFEAATRALADLGTLVLVGEPAGRSLSLNLYSDVHSRGLRIVGIPAPRVPYDGEGESAPDSAELLLGCLAKVQFGTPLPDSAAWFRLSDATDADIVR